MTILDHEIKLKPTTTNEASIDNVQKPLLVIVEDNPLVSRCLELQLTPYFDLQCFTRAEGALIYIGEYAEEIELIILDYVLPGMNGLELLSIIRKEQDLKHLRVILQSAASKSTLNMETVKPDFYLEKPWTHQQMLSAIENVLGLPIRT